jgi:hypothetical protein
MGTVKRLAAEVERGLGETHPGLRKTLKGKLALAVGAMKEADLRRARSLIPGDAMNTSL